MMERMQECWGPKRDESRRISWLVASTACTTSLLVALVQLVASLLLWRQECDWPRTRIPDAKDFKDITPDLGSSELVDFS